MGLTDAMAAVARVAGGHPDIVRAYEEIPATVTKWPSVLVLPGVTQQLDADLEGSSWLYLHRLRLWLMVGPMTTSPIARLQQAAGLAPELMRRINRAFVEGDPAFAPYQTVAATTYDGRFVPDVADTPFWGGEITVDVKEHTLYGID